MHKLLDKRKSDDTNQRVIVDNQNMKAVSFVELLGIQIDDKLNFSNICMSAANQLNALIRLKQFKEKKILINNYIMANFNYCPSVWMFSSASSLKKIETFKRGL